MNGKGASAFTDRMFTMTPRERVTADRKACVTA
jgi:hypothetical protein